MSLKRYEESAKVLLADVRKEAYAEIDAGTIDGIGQYAYMAGVLAERLARAHRRLNTIALSAELHIGIVDEPYGEAELLISEEDIDGAGK